MTENEAKRPKVAIIGGGRNAGRTLKAHIDLLEELESYRAMEQRLKNVYGECDGLLEVVIQHLENHENIELPECIAKCKLLTDEDVDKWEAYKAIGTVEECRVAVERMKPKKPIPDGKLEEGAYIKWTCPSCGGIRWSGYYYTPLIFDKVCTDCLQAIDWSE